MSSGSGSGRPIPQGTPARSAWLLSPSSVTLDPRGRLIVADTGSNMILRLNGDRRLTVLAGNVRYAGVYGVGRPTAHASPDGPTGLAYDARGDLWITGFSTKTLLYIDRTGTLREPSNSAVYAR